MVIIILIILGLSSGSFVNALVWRLHQQGLPTKKRVASKADLSVSTGRSMCPHCQHTLSALDLLPLVSWLALRGRCRYCKHAIGWQYPLVEAATALLYVLSYLCWPFAFHGLGIFLLAIWLLALIGLMALFIYDLRWMLLPNVIVFPVIALGLVQFAAQLIFFHGGITVVWQTVAAVAISGGIFFVLFQVSDGKWIGGGDPKLGYALGLLLARADLAILMLFSASLIGLAFALPGLITKKLTGLSRIPFGPALILASVIVMLFGRIPINWYLHTVLAG